jgi:antirestriction protein ArdC
MEAKKSIYQIITNKFVEQLEQGIVPWHKPWSVVGSNEVAISYTTRKPYSLLNQMLLGWKSGEYLTFKQIQDLKGQVKKGAKSSMVVFYTPIKVTEKDEVTGEEIEKTIRCLKYYNVFHINDTIGIQSKVEETEATNDVSPIEEAENLIKGYLEREKTLTFINDKVSDSAYFSPSQDIVNVPCIKQYKVVEEYYSTTFHELTHSTLVESRCNRKTNCVFGSEYYAKEELVAEIGSAMLCSLAGIESAKAFSNSVAYVQSWLRKLRNDSKLIVIASAQAEKAVKYIANIQD